MTLQDTLARPEVRSIGEYDPASRSAQELYGDDILLHVWWKGNPWFVAASTYRVSPQMRFADFWTEVFVPYHEEDPDFDASRGWEQFDWFRAVNRDTEPVDVTADVTLAGLGLTHKAVLGFTST